MRDGEPSQEQTQDLVTGSPISFQCSIHLQNAKTMVLCRNEAEMLRAQGTQDPPDVYVLESTEGQFQTGLRTILPTLKKQNPPGALDLPLAAAVGPPDPWICPWPQL